MFIKKNLAASVVAALLLTGCGGSDSETSTFSLAISDAPVNDLSAVYLCFNAVELKGGDKSTTFTIGDQTEVLPANSECGEAANIAGINLFDYTGEDSIALVNNIEVEAGEYTQMRIIMSDGSFAIDEATGDKVAVEVPSNELKLDGFTIAQGGSVDFTLEFDLRKSMTNPVGKESYFLKPRGVRLVDNNEVGTLTGTVTDAFILNECGIASPGPDMELAAVYIYPQADLDIASLEDNSATDGEFSPLASATVTADGAGNYGYEIGFIPVGEYTVAITCNTYDDPDVLQTNVVENTLTGDLQPIAFVESKNASIAVDPTAEVPFGS